MTQIKFCISFTKEFYKKLKKCAEARNVTVASYIKEAIAQRMDNEMRKNKWNGQKWKKKNLNIQEYI